ncbi:DUF2637 domain-containing protein [Streptomyces niveus]|uniref:DUF2637 domain-containing protein n=1 Tax=Streptomyces niveus TaxID=193462 RepID=UPI0036374CC4
MATSNSPVLLTRTHRILIGVVVAGAVLIAAIGFAGSYSAVRDLAEKKGFGQFSIVFPIGIDAGICVLLALDLLLTWMRIPFPLLRQTAWLLTAATIAFNGAAAWPDPLGVGMHAVIPILFVVSVEAARHAVGRIADITADRHMEGVRLTRWLLSPVPTFKLWRRMKLWEIRSYEDIIQLEQDRLIYQARLQARYGRNWRRKAPIEAMMPLRLAKYGVPLADTGPAGLAAAGIEPALLPPAPATATAIEPAHATATELPQAQREQERELTEEEWIQLQKEEQSARKHEGGPRDSVAPTTHESPWSAAEEAEPESLSEPADEAVTYLDVFRAYTAEYGTYPNVEQFSEYLVGTYGVRVDERELEQMLGELLQEMAEPVTDEHGGRSTLEMTGADAGPAEHPHPATHSQSVAHAPAATERAPAIAGAAGGRMNAGGLPHQMTTDTNRGAADGSSVPVEPTVWEASVTDTGEATARAPEPRDQEEELDPVAQQIITVAGWVEEAEAAGGKLAGAEVARRLGLSPKSGQRRVIAAAEYLEEQRRQQGRTRLRSVQNQS